MGKVGWLVTLLANSKLLCVVGTSSKMDYLPLGDVRTDPVTTPGECLSPHMHTFYGSAASLRPSTTYEEMRAACGNSGNVDDNKSLYWHPTIYMYLFARAQHVRANTRGQTRAHAAHNKRA